MSDLIGEYLVPELLERFPTEQITGMTQQVMGALDEFSAEGFTRRPTEVQANVLLIAEDALNWVIPISVAREVPHRITGINFVPVPVPPEGTLSPATDLTLNAVNGSNRTDGLDDIGDGRQMYLSCVGEDGPTVVLDSGLGDTAAAWFGIESAVSGFARVCTYDRAGSIGGARTPAEGPRLAKDVVADLRAVLRAADIPGPYVLVGHSIGGVFARVFAHTWPEDVAGMVLVDVA